MGVSLIIFDTESDGLLFDKISYNWETHERTVEPAATKFHIFGWTTDGENYESTTNQDLFLEELDKHDMAGCHNSARHDFPLLTRLTGYDYKGLRVDTLALSWYLFPNRVSHGLESWGVDLGVSKVEVQSHEWQEGNLDLMKSRVTEDVKINWLLWKKQERILEELYNGT